MHPSEFQIEINHIKGNGSVSARRLISVFESLETACKSSRHELLSSDLIDRIVESIINTRADLEQIWSSPEEKKNKVLIWDDADYPRNIKETDQLPSLIYYRGTLKVEAERAASLVGSRRMNDCGCNVARESATLFASRNYRPQAGIMCHLHVSGWNFIK